MTTRQWGWRASAALVVLSVIPIMAGAARLVGLVGGPEIISADARFTASPLPVAVHIVSAAVYALLGALQFATGFRRRRPGWHRAAGRAGAQVFTEGVGGAAFGHSPLTLDASRGAAWVINLAVAEWVIRRRRPVGGSLRGRPAARIVVGERS